MLFSKSSPAGACHQGTLSEQEFGGFFEVSQYDPLMLQIEKLRCKDLNLSSLGSFLKPMNNLHSDLKHKTTHLPVFSWPCAPICLNLPLALGVLSASCQPRSYFMRKMEAHRQEHLPPVTPWPSPAQNSVPSSHRLPSMCWWPSSAACLPKDLVPHLSPRSYFTNLSFHGITPLDISTCSH